MLVNLAYNHKKGPELRLRVLRVRSKEANIFYLFGRGFQSENTLLRSVKCLLDDGEASVLDFDGNGATALHVSHITFDHCLSKRLNILTVGDQEIRL